MPDDRLCKTELLSIEGRLNNVEETKAIGGPQRMSNMKIHDVDENPKRPGLFSSKSKRLRVLLMIGFALFANGMMKTNMSMAMVCMVNTTAVQNERTETEGELSNLGLCGNTTQNVNRDLHYDGTFIWSTEQQSSIFAAFFWGGLISVMMTTWLSDRFGTSRILLFSGIVNVIGSLLTPIAADNGVWWITGVRFVMGFGQGVLQPLCATVAASWFPLEEKSLASAIYTNGNQLSHILAMLFSAQLCQWKDIGGWRGIFHAYGILGIVMSVLWWWIVSDTPHDAKDISEAERNYIVGNLKKKRGRAATPWIKMITSPIVLTLIMCSIGQALTIITLTTYLPQYFKHVLQMDLTSNGILSALPFICQMTLKFVVGAVADALKKVFPTRLDLITKCSNSLATYGAAICLVVLSLLSCGQDVLAVFLICVSVSCLSGYVGGYFTSLLSVAPSHTAALNSITRFFAQASSVVTPYMVGYITTQNTPSEWAIVFCIIGAVLTCAGTAFCVYGTLEPLEWSKPQSVTDEVNSSSEKKTEETTTTST